MENNIVNKKTHTKIRKGVLVSIVVSILLISGVVGGLVGGGISGQTNLQLDPAVQNILTDHNATIGDISATVCYSKECTFTVMFGKEKHRVYIFRELWNATFPYDYSNGWTAQEVVILRDRAIESKAAQVAKMYTTIYNFEVPEAGVPGNIVVASSSNSGPIIPE